MCSMCFTFTSSVVLLSTSQHVSLVNQPVNIAHEFFRAVSQKVLANCCISHEVGCSLAVHEYTLYYTSMVL